MIFQVHIEVLRSCLLIRANRQNNSAQITQFNCARYNCGPEVIEYLTGTRLSQEDTVLFHSYLVEQDLLGDNFLPSINL